MDGKTPIKKTRSFENIEKVGLVLVVLSLIAIIWRPDAVGELFNAMFNRATPIVVKVYLTGSIGSAIIISVTMGRLLERLGFTDALMRIFVPLMRIIGVNAAIAIPSVYNILGDINAAGRIGGPILKKACASKDEQKIAIATMMQSQSSFSIFVFGLIALSAAKVSVFVVVFLAIFTPVILTPFILKNTIWRDTKAVSIEDLPNFTPSTAFLPTIFNAAKEGAELLFLLIIPACAVVFAAIGALDFFGIWKPFEDYLFKFLTMCNIDPQTGSVAMLAGGSLAMAQLKDIATTLRPETVVGSYILASSGFPLQVIFGQIPTIWSGATDLNEREAMIAAIVGGIIKIATAAIFATFLQFLYM